MVHWFTLWQTKIATENGPVDLLMKNGDFPYCSRYVSLVCQRVRHGEHLLLPIGSSPFFLMKMATQGSILETIGYQSVKLASLILAFIYCS